MTRRMFRARSPVFSPPYQASRFFAVDPAPRAAPAPPEPKKPAKLDATKDESGDPACTICMDNRSTVVFLPCGHAQTCRTCTNTLATKAFPFKCIMCNQPVTNYNEVYFG